ncbi:head-tail joining protein [Magnetofaba australis]|uniref:Phage protein n=1 Tax=Magnetofaba australis IT-1 TaxID=1434232 RepID=A0A1Y2K9N4_9PROT|nr:hypothetical protein [Magnetofaba australis]OSM07662.1 hypothetical protein MAIT1_04575 [Magnetofaba australis IT-1]
MNTFWTDAVASLDAACQQTFGIQVTYIPSMANRPDLYGKSISLTGIFDDAREMVTLMGGPGMEAVVPRPVLEIRSADLGFTPTEGDEVMVDGITYRILDVQPDGHGSIKLVLSRNPSPG